MLRKKSIFNILLRSSLFRKPGCLFSLLLHISINKLGEIWLSVFPDKM